MRNIERDANALAIATAVIRVGQSLKMAVVAEGVETEGQRQLLAGLGCDVVQGYLCAPAMSPEAFGRWLLDHVAEQAQMMRKSIEEARSQPTPSLLIASTGG
jgi:EAL domain-containing protein (putative c-di-GMP-specific phosphodiesterase class I)